MSPLIIKRSIYLLIPVTFWIQTGIDPAQAKQHTPLLEAGKNIYTKGINHQGESIDAHVGEANITLPSTTLPCAGCHGDKAEGGEEGGVKPPPLSWSHLTKHYGHVHGASRRHPAFTETTFSTAVRTGYDPGGNRMDSTMPRFALSDDDIDALIIYLKQIDEETSEGVTESSIRIGTLIPTSGKLARYGDAIGSALKYRIDRINARGGLFGRRLELVTASYQSDLDTTLSNLDHLIKEENIFALVSPFFVGIEDPGAQLAEENKVPVVAPYSQLHGVQKPEHEYLFYLRSGFREQARAFMRYHNINNQATNNILVIRPSGLLDGVAESVHAEAERLGWNSREHTIESARRSWSELIAGESRENHDLVMFYGSSNDLNDFLTAADRAEWYPFITIPEVLADAGLFYQPAKFTGRIFLTHPDPVGEKRYRASEMIESYINNPTTGKANLEIKLSALNAVQVVDESLRRAGRELSRSNFIKAMESLSEWDSTIGPNISFGANRRVASQGSRIVSVDLKSRSVRIVSEWYKIE